MSNYPPDRRKHGYAELEKKLDDHIEYFERRLRRFFTQALFAFAVLGLTSAGALLGFGVVLKEQDRTAVLIQKQRYDYIFETCKQQNERHLKAVATAEKLFGPRPKTQDNVVKLVSDLQPFTDDCVGQAKSRVQGDRDVKIKIEP